MSAVIKSFYLRYSTSMKSQFQAWVRYIFSESHQLPSASTKDLVSESQLKPASSSETSIMSASYSDLKKEVEIYGALSLIVGTIIGSGIFASASTVAEKSGSVGMILLVWTGCGILAMLGSLCYIELGLSIETSGGEYTYLFKAFGPVVAFMHSWSSNLVIRPASMSAICLAFGNYVVEPFFTNEACDSNEVKKAYLAKLLAALAIGKYN